MDTTQIIEIVGAIVGAALVYALQALASWAKAKAKTERGWALDSAIDALTDAAEAGVRTAEKTIVARAKADGEWDGIAQQAARDAAVAAASAILTPERLAVLKASGADMTALFAASIEAANARQWK